MKTGAIVGLALGALTLGVGAVLCAGALGAVSSQTAKPTILTTNTAPERPRSPAVGPAKIEAGTWKVGAEIKPGTYTTTADGYCYWARLKAFDGELDSILANGNLGEGERGRLTVKATDKGVELSGDCTWTRVAS